jgi:hypothetical protein
VSTNPKAPEGAVDAFLQTIEQRYAEWELEFGDEVDERRTTAFEGKHGFR